MKYALGILLLLVFAGPARGQTLPAEEPLEARQRLLEAREAARKRTYPSQGQKIRQFIALGMWVEAASNLQRSGGDFSSDWLAARFDWARANYRFNEMEAVAAEFGAFYPNTLEYFLMRSELFRQAWILNGAAAADQAAVTAYPDSVRAWASVGETLMFMNKFDDALRLGRDIQQRFPTQPQGYLLEAKAHFWKNDIPAAVTSLEACLRLAPFDPDARFFYGYAIWRAGNAARLTEMAYHWEVALSAHPLHFLTHWHWGNGHTPFTFAQYADPDESVIREALAPADSLARKGELDAALALIREAESQHFSSALPNLYLGSFWYLYPGPNKIATLDSAQTAFLRALRKKPHFGPAHNGLAAVIRQRQMMALTTYDSIELAINRNFPQDPYFFSVFPDAGRIPDDRLANMVWNQLHSSRAYLPLLTRLNLQFKLLPLHEDLALGMNNLWFRSGVTFDNRQWMDIRGVGSGAVGIEYVERAAHLERNVPLHEFIHLVHGQVLTETENRRISELYFKAMAANNTLDYYAAMNEYEYLAQAYPAFFTQRTVNPLNHKSLATRAMLQQKDPELFAFLDSLTQKEQAALQGNKAVLAGNWAQAYVMLSARALTEDPSGFRAVRMADSALSWQPGYRPAILARADGLVQQRKVAEARAILEPLQKAAPAYTPVLAALARLELAQYEQGGITAQQAWERAAQHLKAAIRLEKDPHMKSDYQFRLWQLHYQFSRWQEAVSLASEVAAATPPISTTLRYHIRRARTFVAEVKGSLGYHEEADAFFGQALKEYPQDEALLMAYARYALAANKDQTAFAPIQALDDIRQAAGAPDAALAGFLARACLQQGDTAGAIAALTPIREGVVSIENNYPLWIRVYLALGEVAAARRLLLLLSKETAPALKSEFHYLTGQSLELTQDYFGAMNAYDRALGENPYHLEARQALLRRLSALGDPKEIRRVAGRGDLLPLPPGPYWQTRLNQAQEKK